jgi:ribonuclease HII
MMIMVVNVRYENYLRQRLGSRVIAGIDEVGRGPLAGPVTAAAFVFVRDVPLDIVKRLRDSKKLSPRQRNEFYQLFCEFKKAGLVDFATASVFPTTIDQRRIHHAVALAMRRAVEKLTAAPDFAVIDKFLYGRKILTAVPYALVTGADALVPSCAAASIVGKVKRDRTMVRYHRRYPQYRFDLHKGYGTQLHYEMLAEYGPSPIHRRSFRLH